MIRTKIVATVGPVTLNPDSLLALVDAGISVARLNGAHADIEWHRSAISLIQTVLPGVPILLDIPGRKIRTAWLAHEPKFEVGDRIVFTADNSFDGTTKVPINDPQLYAELKPGDVILADDGTLRFEVEQLTVSDIICRAATRGQLGSRKGINVPFVTTGNYLISDTDQKLIALAKQLAVDFVGISFVESAAQVSSIRELIRDKSPRILAKIETSKGLDNLEEIIDAADAIMIDRGDLSVETSIESVIIDQKRIIERSRAKGKPVAIATQLLHSMIHNDFPTKAEIADITNAVIDGCSALMLSGETAIGHFPLEAVRTMRRIADAAFEHVQSRVQLTNGIRGTTASQAIEDAIAMLLLSLPITKVVVVTFSGYAARMISARMVPQPIFAISSDAALARALNLCSGVEGIHFKGQFERGSADHIKACIRHLYALGKLEASDLVLVTAAIYPRSGTRMNSIQIHKLSDLIEEFGWANRETH